MIQAFDLFINSVKSTFLISLNSYICTRIIAFSSADLSNS